jgi:hypothetical protein
LHYIGHARNPATAEPRSGFPVADSLSWTQLAMSLFVAPQAAELLPHVSRLRCTSKSSILRSGPSDAIALAVLSSAASMQRLLDGRAKAPGCGGRLVASIV